MTTKTIRLDSKTIKSAINSVSCACDRESTRYSLGGILVEFTPTETRFIATDGRRLHIATLSKCEVHTIIESEFSVLLPTDVWKALAGGSSKGIVQLEIESTGRVTAYIPKGAKGDKIETVSGILEGRFPNYRQVMPSDTASMEITGNVATVLAWITRVTGTIPTFTWDNDGIPSVSYRMTELKGGKSYEPKLSIRTRVPRNVSFNVQYLRDMIDGFPERATVELMVHDNDVYKVKIGTFVGVFMGYR